MNHQPEIEILRPGVEHIRPIKPNEPQEINQRIGNILQNIKKSKAFNVTTVFGLGVLTVHEIANGIPQNATIPALIGGMELKRLFIKNPN